MRKTRVYYYEEEKLKNINMDFLPKIANTKNELEYLGFCFTGDKIKIRDKTMSKFYYRMYKKIKTIALSHGKTKSGKIYQAKNYINYILNMEKMIKKVIL